MADSQEIETTPKEVQAEISRELSDIHSKIKELNPSAGGITVTVDPDYNVKIQINHGNNRYSYINYKYDEEYDRGVSFVSGDGGSTDANNVMAGAVTQDDYYSVTYLTQGSCNDQTVASTNEVVDLLGLNENEDYHIFSCHSDGGTTFFDEVRTYDGKFDLVVCEGAYDDKNFVDGMLKAENESIRNNLRENGGVIIAYESLHGHGAGDPMNAIDNLMRLVDDGADTTVLKSSEQSINDIGEEPLRVIVGINQKINGHSSANGAISTSPIELFKTDEMDAIAEGFDLATYADDGSVIYDENGNPTGGVRTFEGHETRYYNLSSAEFLSGNYAGSTVNGEFIVYLTDKNGNAVDRNGNITDNPDDYVCLGFGSLEELQDYFKTTRAQVENQFISQGKIDEITETTEIDFGVKAQILGLTSQVYKGVVTSANGIIQRANDTTCANKGISDTAFFQNSTSSFPNSLNDSNAFLYSKTATMLDYMHQDMTSLQRVLDGKGSLEEYLANATASLNNGDTVNSGSDTALQVSNLLSIDPMYNLEFTKDIKMGAVGKISVGDLNMALSENGVIMSGLNNEINDANLMIDSIEEFVNSLEMTGEDWKAVKDHFGGYEDICNARIAASNILKQAYSEAINMIQEYIAPDDSMDDGQIPEYEAEIQRLATDIANCYDKIAQLEAENRALAAVGPNCSTYTDKDGNTSESCDWSPVYAARAQIAANEAQIHNLNIHIQIAEAAKKEAEIYLARLQGFASVLNRANQIIAEGITDANGVYQGALDQFNPVTYEVTQL